jgi:hypothetical protein
LLGVVVLVEEKIARLLFGVLSLSPDELVWGNFRSPDAFAGCLAASSSPTSMTSAALHYIQFKRANINIFKFL